MTATDELRALLTERGVEWMPSVFDPQHETFYSVENGVGFIVTEFPEIQRVSLACDMRVTPEQAIDATLGRGTCHIDLVGYDEREDRFQCRSCDWSMSVRRGTWPRFNYCPNCGRRCVG